jgi:hypothetical protein
VAAPTEWIRILAVLVFIFSDVQLLLQFDFTWSLYRLCHKRIFVCKSAIFLTFSLFDKEKVSGDDDSEERVIALTLLPKIF